MAGEAGITGAWFMAGAAGVAGAWFIWIEYFYEFIGCN